MHPMAGGQHPMTDLPSGSFVTGGGLPDDPRARGDAARRAFNRADRDGSGYLDFKEFLDSLRELEVTIAYQHALSRFAKLDKDKDGRICESEFVNGFLDSKFAKKHSVASSRGVAPPQQQAPHYPQGPPQQPGYYPQQQPPGGHYGAYGGPQHYHPPRP